MALEDLQAIGLDPETLFLTTVLSRPINFAPEERTALASNLSETEYVQNWMQQNGYSTAYAEDPFFATYVVLQTGDGHQGLLADIVDNRNSSGNAYQLYQNAALGGTNDVVGQLASGYFNGFSGAIDTMLTEIGEAYPNWTESQVQSFVRILMLDEAKTTQYGADNFLEAIENRADEILGNQCFGAGTPIDMWPLDPELAPDPANPFKQYDQEKVRAGIWIKPIEQIKVGDYVIAHDKQGNMVPGYVPRTMTNTVKVLLDFFGTRVTPGHVYYRPDSKKADKYETLIDILRDDGMIEDRDGVKFRAATYAPVDGPLDKFVQAVTGTLRSDGGVDIKEQGRIRLGTRFIVRNDKGRKDYSVADLIEAGGGVVGDDELIRVGDGPGVPFHWDFGNTLPKPEDFVLAASGTTLEGIYKAAEWESQSPHLPAPMVLDGGPVQPLKGAELSAMPRNEPLNLGHTPEVPQKSQRMIDRKQRKAMEAKSRKAAKARKRAGS